MPQSPGVYGTTIRQKTLLGARALVSLFEGAWLKVNMVRRRVQSCLCLSSANCCSALCKVREIAVSGIGTERNRTGTEVKVKEASREILVSGISAGWNRSGTGLKVKEASSEIIVSGVGTEWNRTGTGVKSEEALCISSISFFGSRSEPYGTGPEPDEISRSPARNQSLRGRPVSYYNTK